MNTQLDEYSMRYGVLATQKQSTSHCTAPLSSLKRVSSRPLGRSASTCCERAVRGPEQKSMCTLPVSLCGRYTAMINSWPTLESEVPPRAELGMY